MMYSSGAPEQRLAELVAAAGGCVASDAAAAVPIVALAGVGSLAGRLAADGFEPATLLGG